MYSDTAEEKKEEEEGDAAQADDDETSTTDGAGASATSDAQDTDDPNKRKRRRRRRKGSHHADGQIGCADSPRICSASVKPSITFAWGSRPCQQVVLVPVADAARDLAFSDLSCCVL